MSLPLNAHNFIGRLLLIRLLSLGALGEKFLLMKLRVNSPLSPNALNFIRHLFLMRLFA
jgi:hypothetical protein